MTLAELFWQASLEQLKRGYWETENHLICLLCGKYYEKGLVYPEDGVIYEAERYMRRHIRLTHQSVFDYLLNLDKKLTGLTEHQKKLLRLFRDGKSDKEIQSELNIGSSSTIRNHRYVLKEKERQAKILLALVELMKHTSPQESDFIEVHPSALMVDDRYNVTNVEEQEILARYFPQGRSGPLKEFPRKEKLRLVILRELVKRFDKAASYDELQVNEILQSAYADYALVRRYMIEYGFMARNPDGSQYWLIS